jgi:hypothetical protein
VQFDYFPSSVKNNAIYYRYVVPQVSQASENQLQALSVASSLESSSVGLVTVCTSAGWVVEIMKRAFSSSSPYKQLLFDRVKYLITSLPFFSLVSPYNLR